MNKKIFLLSVVSFMMFFLVSCDETEDPGQYINWRERNEAFIDSLQKVHDARTDDNLFAVADQRNGRRNIFFKKIKGVNEGQPPFYTSRASVYYRGMTIDESVFANNDVEFYTSLYEDMPVFDQNFTGANPTDLDVPSWMYLQTRYASDGKVKHAAVIDGWVAFLQVMKKGERWEVYIPWQSGYGQKDVGTRGQRNYIPGYSTLIFDIELVDIDYYPEE